MTSTDSSGTRRATTYASSGVDIEAGDRAVELMKEWVARTHRPEVVGGLGGFAGLFDASALRHYRRPLLATSTDGVGTKVAIAQRMGIHHTIGFDLVGMVVDDIVVCGAEPLFMTDYIACGRVVPERIADLVRGIAEACVVAGCSLSGGETAEHPGLLDPDEYDVAGAATGVVEASDVLGPERVRAGDVIIALASSGLHANGYSLVRRTMFDIAEWSLDRDVPEFGRTVGEELLEPTRVYARDILALAQMVDVHAVSHITGGGIAGNLGRVMPDGLVARVDRSTWTPPAVFDVVGTLGSVVPAELEKALNMGIGMAVVIAPDAVDDALRLLAERDVPAWIAGTVESHPARAESEAAVLLGSYAH